jgi:hypothetical protein
MKEAPIDPLKRAPAKDVPPKYAPEPGKRSSRITPAQEALLEEASRIIRGNLQVSIGAALDEIHALRGTERPKPAKADKAARDAKFAEPSKGPWTAAKKK